MPFFRRGRMQLKRTMFNSFGRGGPLPPPIFSGTYWYSPLSNNGNDTITNGSFINQGLSIKNVELTTGIQTIPAQTLAVFPNHNVYGNSISGNLIEPEATTQIPSDMSLWSDKTGSTVTYNDTTKENRWLFTGGNVAHRLSNNSAVTQGLDYTLSLFVKKGESQFLQITGSTGFVGFVVNYSLLNGVSNAQIPHPTLKDFGLVDSGDYFRVYLTAEAASPQSSGRLILAKSNSLTDSRLPASSDSGAFTVRYPNFVQASYASSPIDAPLAATTRAKDVVSCPTSAALVDDEFYASDNNGFSGAYTNGISRLSSTSFYIQLSNTAGSSTGDAAGKYFNLLNSKIIGTVLRNNPEFTCINIGGNNLIFTHNNRTEQELIELFGNDGTSTNRYRIDFSTSSLTVAEAEQLRLDVGDTPSIEKPDGSFFWATWPSENITFEAEFTLFNDNPTVVFSMEWENEAEETYSERIGDILKFVHGQDSLDVPYADLLQVGIPYKAKISITPTELIGEVEGIEVGRVTRTDTRLAVWQNHLNQGDFDGAINSCLVSKFKVSDYTVAPPQGNLIVSDASAFVGPLGVGYIDASQTGGTTVGSLNPPVIVDGQQVSALYGLINQSSKVVVIGFDDDAPAQMLATFDGVSYTFTDGFVLSDTLFDFLSANQDTPIQFTAEVAPPQGNLIVVDGEPVVGQAGSSIYYTGSITEGSLNPPVVVGVDTIGFMYTINDAGLGGKVLDLGNDGGITGTDDLLLSFDGQEFTAVYGNGGWRVTSDILYDYLLSKQNIPIVFTAEVASPSDFDNSNNDFADNGDFDL